MKKTVSKSQYVYNNGGVVDVAVDFALVDGCIGNDDDDDDNLVDNIW